MNLKYNNFSIKLYLDFSQLMDEYRGNHEENRVFALKHKSLLKNPKKLLFLWTERNLFHLRERLNSKKFKDYFLTISNLLAVLSLLLGLSVGFGLLSYNGAAPINLIYYLFISMFIPLLSMLLSIFSMFTTGMLGNFFMLFLSLHWIEKLFTLLPFSEKLENLNEVFPAPLKKWMFLNRLQLFSLLFSIGLLLALLFMVATQDIAFAWGTTLNVSAKEFQDILLFISEPWKFFLPSAVPSLELVELSQYYRLGENLSVDLIENVNKLGSWWKFLAMVTLFYAVLLRAILFFVSYLFYKKQLRKELYAVEGTELLLREFQTPYVSTEAPKVENHLEIKEETDDQVKTNLHRAYSHIIGWNFSNDEIQLLNDSKEINGLEVRTVGGSHTFKEDQLIAEKVRRTILLYVKSWEPPTMDFVDFLELLIENKKVDKVEVYPIGTVGRYYESDSKEIAVWKRKIQGLKSEKVWVIDGE